MKIFIDGKFYDRDDAKISVFDHGLLYGDGVFEGLRIYSGKIFKLDEHVKRLYCSAKAILLDVGMTEDEMKKNVIDTVHLNEKVDGYIRLIVTRGIGPLGIDPFQCKKSSVIIIVSDIQLYPEEFYLKGIEVITSSYRRIPPECFDTRIKSLNYLNNILAKIEAKRSGCLESIMLNTGGNVVECTADNIFIVNDNTILTPTGTCGALIGVTRNAVFEIAEKDRIKYEETLLTTYDLFNADECFLTGSGAEIIPVIKIDGRVIGKGIPGNITRQILAGFKLMVNS